MTLVSYETVNCPLCDHRQQVSVMSTINVTNNPELKDQLLSGKLHTYVCEKCNKEIRILNALIYHDMDKLIWLELSYLEDDDEISEEEKQMKAINDRLMDNLGNYTKGVVHSMEELIEKVYILDNNLNERMVDLFKLLYVKKSKLTPHQLYLRGIDRDETGATAFIYINTQDEHNYEHVITCSSLRSFTDHIKKVGEHIDSGHYDWFYHNEHFTIKTTRRVQGVKSTFDRY